MPLINPLRKLMPPGYDYTPPVTGDDSDPYSQNQPSPFRSLAGSTDAVGSDTPTSFPTPLLDKYRSLMENPPNPQNYQPSTGRKILAALSGLSGFSPAAYSGGAALGARYDPRAAMLPDEVMNAPYNRAMGRYETQAKLLGAGAGIEERDLTNKRLLAHEKELEAERKEQNRIRQEQFERESARDKMMHDDRVAKAQADADKAQKALEEKTREFEGRQGNFQDQLTLHQLELKAREAQHAAENAQRDAKAAENQRLNDAKINKMQEDIDTANRRADIAAGKGGPTVTETTTTTPAIPPKKLFGYEIPFTGSPAIDKKEVTTVKKPLDTAVSAPAGQKPPAPVTTQPGKTKMRGPDGNDYLISNDKVEQYKMPPYSMKVVAQ